MNFKHELASLKVMNSLLREYQRAMVEMLERAQEQVFLPEMLTGAAMGAVAAASYEFPSLLKSMKISEEVGPREWSPRTGKCLCVKPCRG